MKWINIKEQWPEKYSKVLVTNGEEICIGIKQSNYSESIYCSKYCQDCPMGGGEEGAFTHWMPLPELPKGTNEVD